LISVLRLHGFIVFILAALPLFGSCRVPDISPDAIARMTPAELLESGHYLRAVRVLEPLSEQRPKDGEVAWLLSRAKAALGDLDSALRLAELAVTTNEANAAYRVQLASVAGRLAERASLFKQLGLARRTKRELEAAAALDPKNSDAQWGLMMYYFAAPSFMGGDKSKAVQRGDQLVKSVPDRGLFYRARLAREMNDANLEESLYKQAILANPLLFDASEALAIFYFEARSDTTLAETWACQAVHTDPTRGQGWKLLARVYASTGCWTEAAELAARFEAINPDDLAPYYAIAVTAMERGEQLETAEAYLRRYIGRPTEGNEPSTAYAHWQLATVLEKLNRPVEAMVELRLAVDKEPSLDGARQELKRLTAELRR
jgi:tetratricopeptide (TPR) repeat protein